MTTPRNPDYQPPHERIRSLMARAEQHLERPTVPMFPLPAPEETIYDRRSRLLEAVASQLVTLGRGER